MPNKQNIVKEKRWPKLINLTGHDIVLFIGDQPVVLPSTPDRVRVDMRTSITRTTIPYRGVQIPVTTVGIFDTEDLPEPKDGILYVVSWPVARENIGKRGDLLIVNGRIRDERGGVLGATSLARLDLITMDKEKGGDPVQINVKKS